MILLLTYRADADLYPRGDGWFLLVEPWALN